MSNPEQDPTETYLTKKQPTIEDWLEYNEGLFDALRTGTPPEKDATFAPLTDFDEHADRAGVDTLEYFEELKSRVGNLGTVALRLAYSEMDDAVHVVIGPDSDK